MLLFIEGYPYNLDQEVRNKLTVRDILKDVVEVPKLEHIYSFGYVGYCYSKAAKDVIFFLPKVVLTGENEPEKETIFGASPQSIIDFDSKNLKEKFTEEGHKDYKEFLSTLSIWIYRTISVYKEECNDNILENREHQKESGGRKQKHNTLLDVIIALRDFNKHNQDYLTFIAKNLHSGYNKIQWAKTIAHSQAIIQNGRPIYTEPINKKRIVNFDEELLIIYFSILNYIREIHGFSFTINIQYPLISPDKLRRSYIEKNLGCRRLKQIKYKYFSDKALRIWDLCYAFFDREYKIAMNQTETDYLLAKDFDHIFEVMIDTLIGGNDKRELPADLIAQKDGKLVDHMFIGQSLMEQSDVKASQTYYIGDSKYYKRAKGDQTILGSTSIYKQYTYARNVIQWNMNLFLNGGDNEHPQLRDTLTEGYNPLPNFFISARIPNRKDEQGKYLSFDDSRLKSQDTLQLNRQFENRLFDRDTLLLCHYDVNFLFIVSLYGRDNKNKQSAWRETVRREFRSRIQDTLNQLYTFRTLQPRAGMDCYQFIQDNFQRLNGKLYRPKTDSNYLVLALMKEDEADMWAALHVKPEALRNEVDRNKELLDSLQTHFHVSSPFMLDTELHVENVGNVGTLNKLPKPELKDILTGLVRKTDTDYSDFYNHTAKAYTMEKIPTSINVMDIKYFLPMVGGNIDGYYKVEKVYFGSKDSKPCLKLNLSSFISLGDARVPIYRIKMQPGELITYGLMTDLYEQQI
ncbi:MAG: LlaJI family restriction endonuclease [Bacteroidetes bacterium]|uniref:LlaJI family restriction endonuclease n=1 Tax=Candidatus Gallipaludibacter merdavium TaxID=2840839 RepID=A0A9D9N3N3_9BACT|nr:LlaJI family restriction endonuclease [Candidatus Gallipaludibacter merdavium]